MIAPDDHAAYVTHASPALERQLRLGSVVVQAGHGGEIAWVQVGGVGSRDERVGVGRIPNHQDPHVTVGGLVQGASLDGENARVGHQQVLALHVRGSRSRAHQQCVLCALESNFGPIGELDAVKGVEGAVVQFHGDAPQRIHGGRDFDQLEYHGLIRPEKLPGSDTEGQLVADLSRRAGDGDAHRRFSGVVHCGRELR